MTAGGFPHSEILGSKPCRRLPEAYRGPTRPSSVLSAKASTTRPCKPHGPQATTQCQTTNHRQHQITKRSQTNTKTSLESERNQQRDTRHTGMCSLASTLQFSNHHRTHANRHTRNQSRKPAPAGQGTRTRQNTRRGGPGTQERAHTTPTRPRQAHRRAESDLFHTSNPPHDREHPGHKGRNNGSQTEA